MILPILFIMLSGCISLSLDSESKSAGGGSLPHLAPPNYYY